MEITRTLRKKKWSTRDRKKVHILLDPDVWEFFDKLSQDPEDPEAAIYGRFSDLIRQATREFMEREKETDAFAKAADRERNLDPLNSLD